ncbi:MAG TPA: metallophosphoesterase [Niabella sp.]|nr:metallophosphoesterase [Niabella sp.]
MKIIALGDTHGRNKWKQVVSRESFDKLIFIGDYFDSHDGISAVRQKENFKEILAYKECSPEKVVLLIGNHDFHYLDGVYETYSGYQQRQRSSIQALLQPAVDKGLLQVCFVWKHLLFSHAGVTRTWCRNHLPEGGTIEHNINSLFRKDLSAFAFALGRTNNPTGDDPEQSPLWVRPPSLLEDWLDSYIQVVGHTVQKSLVLSDEVIFIDTLDTSGEYLVHEDGAFSVGKTVGGKKG